MENWFQKWDRCMTLIMILCFILYRSHDFQIVLLFKNDRPGLHQLRESPAKPLQYLWRMELAALYYDNNLCYFFDMWCFLFATNRTWLYRFSPMWIEIYTIVVNSQYLCVLTHPLIFNSLFADLPWSSIPRSSIPFKCSGSIVQTILK